jgi:hypothetical protein
MRKREIEKLCYEAIAEALGLEPKSPRKVTTPTPVASRRKTSVHRPDHRAAA